jgi:tetratricopeptide (TPR) repeat protein
MLARHDAKSRLQAELLLLENELPADAEARKRVARLFLRAESPSNAVVIFEAVVGANPGDWEAYSGLGDAQFALRNYLAAHDAYRVANRLNPEHAVTQARLGFASQILDSDPTLRGLSPAERHRRSRELLRAALAKVEPCQPVELPLLLPDQAREAMDSAREILSETPPPRNIAVALEANMALALDLWQARWELCPPAGDLDATDRVLAHLAQ